MLIPRAPIIRTLASGMKAIPIASAKDDATILERAFQMTAAALRGDGHQRTVGVDVLAAHAKNLAALAAQALASSGGERR
jgi:hypothetical protein